jgi:SpoVK/Ycf46/Vps4 family AAA+-type ATPase
MARADLLISLVKAGAAGDRAALQKTVTELSAEERAKSHHVLADRLDKALNSVAVTSTALRSKAVQSISRADAVHEIRPEVQLDDLLLPLPVRQEAENLIEEHSRSELLRAHGLKPRHRILLSGPPGNGKTSFAEAIAEALQLPFFVVRYDALIGSYLGETNSRLRALFDYVQTTPCVLFFDEFDAIGKERGDSHETGEIKRIVSFLLMQLDQLHSYVIAIAATNHAELLDRAVWRRFEQRLLFPAPGQPELAEFIGRVVASWNVKLRISPAEIAKHLGQVSFAEALDFCQNVRRRYVLGMLESSIDNIINIELKLWSQRVTPKAADAERSR